MGVQQFLQQIRIRVKGESDVSDQPLLFPLGNEFPEMEFVIILIVVPLQRVQQIVVEIPRAGSLQTGVKFLLCELLILALAPAHQLRCDGICIPGMPVRNRGLESRFAASVVVDKRRIEVSAACGDKAVRHFAHLGNVNASVFVLGQPHQPKAQPEWVPFPNHCFCHAFPSLSASWIRRSESVRPSLVLL